MDCSNPMCVHGQDHNCCNPNHNIKHYKKNATQAMRPYVVGEDLTGVSVSEEDTPELGGMIAIGADNDARWYVSKTFFNENYIADSGDTEKLLESIEIIGQALLEVEHAQDNGAGWYTKGSSGLYQQVYMWVKRGKDAVSTAKAILLK